MVYIMGSGVEDHEDLKDVCISLAYRILRMENPNAYDVDEALVASELKGYGLDARVIKTEVWE